ncbi:MAG TPA: hypothetical protein VGO40_14785, partial [Longimicrobium sp.]|nr:hypothetical protein [Longimicrobium sp.]
AAVDVQPEPASAPTPASAGGVVPVETLVYDPDDALREALRMRERIFAMAGPGDGFREALDELFGLVALGVERRAHAAG